MTTTRSRCSTTTHEHRHRQALRLDDDASPARGMGPRLDALLAARSTDDRPCPRSSSSCQRRFDHLSIRSCTHHTKREASAAAVSEAGTEERGREGAAGGDTDMLRRLLEVRTILCKGLLVPPRLNPHRPDPDLVVKCALTSYLWQSTGGKAHSLIASMPSLIDISLLVGPLWSPDPVEDLLAKPYPSLRRLDLRFNPCPFSLQFI